MTDKLQTESRNDERLTIVLRKCRALAEGRAIQNRDILVSEIDQLLAVSETAPTFNECCAALCVCCKEGDKLLAPFTPGASWQHVINGIRRVCDASAIRNLTGELRPDRHTPDTTK
jgi:hypothetical protein